MGLPEKEDRVARFIEGMAHRRQDTGRKIMQRAVQQAAALHQCPQTGIGRAIGSRFEGIVFDTSWALLANRFDSKDSASAARLTLANIIWQPASRKSRHDQ
jgi:hypothetical protein